MASTSDTSDLSIDRSLGGTGTNDDSGHQLRCRVVTFVISVASMIVGTSCGAAHLGTRSDSSDVAFRSVLALSSRPCAAEEVAPIGTSGGFVTFAPAHEGASGTCARVSAVALSAASFSSARIESVVDLPHSGERTLVSLQLSAAGTLSLTQLFERCDEDAPECPIEAPDVDGFDLRLFVVTVGIEVLPIITIPREEVLTGERQIIVAVRSSGLANLILEDVNGNAQRGVLALSLEWLFVLLGIGVVTTFVVVSAVNSNRYRSSRLPATDIRRVGDGDHHDDGSPNGGDIWP